MSKIKNGFDRLTEANLLVEATSIVTKCTGNAFFADQQVTVLAVGAATSAYGSALDASKSGDKTAIATKDVKRTELIVQLRKLGDLVSAVASGDRLILVSSGFPLVKDREPAPLLTKPSPPVLSSGLNAGQVIATGVKEKGVRAVMHKVTPHPITENSVWTSTVTTSRKFTFENLESGGKFCFMQCLIGTNGQFVESDAVSYIVQ